MIDLDKLQSMLDNALASETKESLNAWMDEQIKKDLQCGILRDVEFDFLSAGFSNAEEIQIATLDAIRYKEVTNDTHFDINDSDKYNLAA